MIELARLGTGRSGRCSSWDRSGRNADRWVKSAVLADLRGPGVITHLWMTQMCGYRECLLKITWDEAPSPSILCPLGDFFGPGNGLVNSYQSLFFSASTNANNRFESEGGQDRSNALAVRQGVGMLATMSGARSGGRGAGRAAGRCVVRMDPTLQRLRVSQCSRPVHGSGQASASTAAAPLFAGRCRIRQRSGSKPSKWVRT
jgi:hypothetical protein